MDRLAQGYFKVADESLTAIADGELWLDFQDLRYAYDEPARRRLLELVVRPFPLYLPRCFEALARC